MGKLGPIWTKFWSQMFQNCPSLWRSDRNHVSLADIAQCKRACIVYSLFYRLPSHAKILYNVQGVEWYKTYVGWLRGTLGLFIVKSKIVSHFWLRAGQLCKCVRFPLCSKSISVRMNAHVCVNVRRVYTERTVLPNATNMAIVFHM